MPDPTTSADLLLRLYDLRREAKMREARDWVIGAFHPDSTEDVFSVIRGEDSAKLRMVLGYWEMAATFVVRGAIDPAMFQDLGGELLATFCKVEPFLDELRETSGRPDFLENTEKVVDDWPGARERMERTRERLRERAAGEGSPEE